MVLMLTNDDADKVLNMRRTIDALEAHYKDLGRGSAVYRGRTDLFTPTTSGMGPDVPSAHQFKTLDGAIPRLQAASIRVTSDVVAFPEVDGKRRRIKIPAAGGGYVGLVFLFSSATGELTAIVQDGLLQRYTVGAINALGAKYLARPDSRTVGLIGAGGQAAPQLMGLKEVLTVHKVRVFSPTTGEAAAFAAANGPVLGLDIEPAASAEAAIDSADVIVTATNSREPFFPGSWLKPGVHLSCMQRDEAQDDCFHKADLVVLHTRAKELEYVSTDFEAMERRLGFTMQDHPKRDLDWNNFPDLGELVAGKTMGRMDWDHITFFLNSTGIGSQFTALAHMIYEGARERGLGHEVPGDWFVEAIQP